MYIRVTSSGEFVYPYYSGDIQKDFPNKSFPMPPSKEDLYGTNIFPVMLCDVPTYDPITQCVREVSPKKIGDTYYQDWEVVELYSPAEREQVLADAAAKAAEEAKAALVASYDQALSNHLDATAQSKRYDNRITCALRAGYPGPFQAEGQAFAAWMDTCNATAYQWWSEIDAGTKPMFASTEEFITALPTFAWPT